MLHDALTRLVKACGSARQSCVSSRIGYFFEKFTRELEGPAPSATAAVARETDAVAPITIDGCSVQSDHLRVRALQGFTASFRTRNDGTSVHQTWLIIGKSLVESTIVHFDLPLITARSLVQLLSMKCQ